MLNHKKAASLIETVIIIVILSIIGATITGVIIFFAQVFLYSPRQLDAQKIGAEIENLVFEGNQSIRGLRYARTIIDASATQFTYIYGYPEPSDGLAVRLRWDAADKHLYRSTSADGGTSWSAETLIPYYISSAVTIDGKDTASVIFTYKKAGDADWVSGTDALTDIRRVIFNVTAQTGTGSFSGFQGASSLTASAEIKGF